MAEVLEGASPDTGTVIRNLRGYFDPAEPERNTLLSDFKLGNAAPGQGLVVTYSFATSASVWSEDYPNTLLADTALAMSADQQMAARRALAEWQQIAQLDFVEVQETADQVGVLRFARSDFTSGAIAFLIDGGGPHGADIWFGTDMDATAGLLGPGSYGYLAFVHEVGHALGLKHPHKPPRILPGNEDWLGASVMSYRSFPGQPTDDSLTSEIFPEGPMALDVEAVRFLYGKRAVATGDDVYRFGPGERHFQTIVDDGGNDLLDGSGHVESLTIDLRMGAWSLVGEPYAWIPGFFSDAGSFPGSVRTALDTVIERAGGGRGDDRITGNGAANILAGHGGDDIIAARQGSDTLQGGAGNDHLLGQEGDDFLLGQDGQDRLEGGAGADRLHGGPLADILDGGAGADDLFGADGPDRLGGGAGDDRVHGGDGRDILAGGQGTDRLGGGAGDDLLNGGPGSDFMTGGTGRDRFVLEPEALSIDRITDFKPGIDQMLLRGGYTGGAFMAAARITGGSTLVDLANGHDVLVVGVTGLRLDWFAS